MPSITVTFFENFIGMTRATKIYFSMDFWISCNLRQCWSYSKFEERLIHYITFACKQTTFFLQKISFKRTDCTTKLETAKMFFCPTHQPTHVGQTVFSVHLVLQYISKTEINKMLGISSRWSLYWHMHFSATVSLYVIINQLINLDMRWKDNELL